MLTVSVMVVFATPTSSGYAIGNMWLPAWHVEIENAVCLLFSLLLSPEKIE